MSWFVRELLKVLGAPLIAVGLLVMAIVTAGEARSDRASTALAVGLAGGAIPMLVEIVLAWRSGTVFVRDPAAVAARKRRNASAARRAFAPAVALGVAFAVFPSLLRVVVLAIAAGYLLPWSVLLVGHFLRNHEEIERLTQ